MQYHVNGRLVPQTEATVSVDDRGFQYGDGAFETMRAYGGDVFALDAHLDRLERTCDALALDHGVARGELAARIAETLEANALEDAYVKLSITRGSQPPTVTPHADVDPTVVVYAKSLPRGGLRGESVWDEAAVVQTVKTRKPPANALPPSAKTHNYLNSILARTELVADADEALLRDQRDRVAETATANVFWVDDEGLHTPAADLDLLPGITRRFVLDLARERGGVPVHTGEYGVEAVRNAKECFLTNSTWELRPVASVDGIEVGGGPVTDLLSGLFDRLVEERHYGGVDAGDAANDIADADATRGEPSSETGDDGDGDETA